MNSSVEIESRLDSTDSPYFVLVSYSLMRDHRRSTSTCFVLHLAEYFAAKKLRHLLSDEKIYFYNNNRKKKHVK